jgi:tetratricopeptide (TPR) repeat protein
MAADAADPKPQWQRLLTGEDARKAAELGNQIGALYAPGDADAIRLYEEYLALRTRLQGADHWQTINARWELSNARKFAALSPEKYAAWHRLKQETNPESNRLKGPAQYARALDLEQQRLAECRELLGEDDPITGARYNKVANLLLNLDKPDEAVRLHEKALEIRLRTLGADHPDTARSYNNLAYSLDAAGKYAEAAPLYGKALDTWRRVLGENDASTAQGYHNLAGNLANQAKYAEALPLFQRALDIRRTVLGEENPLTAHTYGGIANCLASQGKYAEEEPFCRKNLDICRKSPGENHPDTARAYNNLGENLRHQGKYADAGPLYLKALDIDVKVHGENHPSVAVKYNNLATFLSKLGRDAEAEPLLRKALDINRKIYGENHPQTARSYASLAASLNHRKKYAEAAPLHQKALDIRRKLLGEDHPDTARSYDAVAYNLAFQGQFAEAARLYEKALLILRKALGDDHRDLVWSYRDLAIAFHGQGKQAETLAALQQSASAYEAARLRIASGGLDRAIFGAEFSPYPLLAATLARAGRPAEAWAALEHDRARGLLDDAALRRGGLSPEEQQRRDALAAEKAPLDARVLALLSRPQRTAAEAAELERLHQQRQSLEGSLAELASSASQREVASLAQVQAALPADTAFVTWVGVGIPSSGWREHWGCVVPSRGAPCWEPVPGSGPDGKWTQEDGALMDQLLRAVAGSAPLKQFNALKNKLYAQLFAPLSKHLRGVKRLYVTTISGMPGMPIEALTDEYTVTYIPSGTYLARLHEHERAHGSRLLAVGDPVFPQAPVALPSVRLPPGGLLTTLVLPDGNAARARLQAGDVLVAYAGEDLSSLEQLDQLIAAHAASRSVVVKVWRDGQDKLTERELAPGSLGVVLANEPAREAILARWHQVNHEELPGTRVEVERLTGLFDPKAVTSLTRADASEQRLDELRKTGALSQYRYLHLATHGRADTARSFDSALILSPPDRVPELRAGEPWLDGRLTAGEVLEYWKLDADLVTLSACESGLGRAGGGDGLLGFAQAFLLAGSRSVCLALWQVDDTATVLLMDRFYRNLLGKREDGAAPMGKAAGLQEAKHWLRTLSVEEAPERTGVLAGGLRLRSRWSLVWRHATGLLSCRTRPLITGSKDGPPTARLRNSSWTPTWRARAGSRCALPPRSRSMPAGGDRDWIRISIRFRAPQSGSTRIYVHFVGWGRATGTAWFDDLKPVEARQNE